MLRWEEALELARKDHYLLSYFQSNQLRVLHRFFIAKSQGNVNSHDILEEGVNLLKLVNPTLNIDTLPKMVLFEYHKVSTNTIT